MQQGDYTALATEPFFLWVFLSFRAAFLAARSANRLVVALGGDFVPGALDIRPELVVVKPLLGCRRTKAGFEWGWRRERPPFREHPIPLRGFAMPKPCFLSPPGCMDHIGTERWRSSLVR